MAITTKSSINVNARSAFILAHRDFAKERPIHDRLTGNRKHFLRDIQLTGGFADRNVGVTIRGRNGIFESELQTRVGSVRANSDS